MSRTTDLVKSFEDIQKDCKSLMAKANEFAVSKDPRLRALAYEISVGVSKILAEQKPIFVELQEILLETGALAE